MHTRSIKVLGLSVAVVLVGCLAARAKPVPTGPPPAGWVDPRRHGDSVFGIQYVFPHDYNQPIEMADRYRDVGAHWVKFQHIQWAVIEPDPPKEGRHRYDWAKLDSYVAAWQRAGYNIQFEVTATSDWALGGMAGPATEGLLSHLLFRNRARGVKSECLVDYGDFISALVERYDGDGKDDMPGLLVPILYHEIESEVQHIMYWTGSLEDYRILLKTAYVAAKRACPEAKVVLSGIYVGDLVKDSPSDDALDSRYRAVLARAPANTRELGERVRAFIPAIFDFKESFDLVEFHALENYTTIPGTYAWIKTQMRKRGYDRPVWVGDATSVIEIGPHVGLPGDYVLPPKEQKAVLSAYKGSLNPKHELTVRWLGAEQAKLSIKKIVVTAGVGSEKIFLGGLEDWPGPFSPMPYHGLANPDGSPRPVYQAIHFLAEKIDGFRSVQKIETGGGVWAYRFDMGPREVLVAWYDDGRIRLPGETESAVEAVLPLRGPSARVTPIPTEGQARGGPGTQAHVVAGKVKISLAQTPVVVEPGS